MSPETLRRETPGAHLGTGRSTDQSPHLGREHLEMTGRDEVHNTRGGFAQTPDSAVVLVDHG